MTANFVVNVTHYGYEERDVATSHEMWMPSGAADDLKASGPAAGAVVDTQDLQHRFADAVGNDERHFRHDEFAGAGDAAGMAEFWIYRETVFHRLDEGDGDAAGSIRIILGDVFPQVSQVEERIGRPDDYHAPLGMGRSLRPPHDDTQALTWA
jgi:hypothetical protein